MEKEIKKLKKLGMSSKEAVIFLRKIAYTWFKEGKENISYLSPGPIFSSIIIQPDSFDTIFSKKLAKLSDDEKNLYCRLGNKTR